MPRKKTSKQSLGELLGVKMPSNDQDNLFRVLDGLPPIVYWAQCRTADQEEHFLDLKQGYQFLKEEIQRYFGGAGSLIPRLEAGDRDFFCALRDRYLAWYTVVQLGWDYIEEELKLVGLTPKDIQASCPGEALIRVLENECAAFTQPAFMPYSRYSVNEDRKLAKTQSAIQRGKASEKAIATYKRKTKQNVRDVERFFQMTHGMVEICEKHSKKVKGLSAAIKRYNQATAYLESEVQRQHHKRNGRKGHEWRNGEKRSLAKG